VNFEKTKFKKKDQARPAPTGAGCAIWGYGVVEDIQEPMHTKYGVPGLSGYTAIRYFALALISASVVQVSPRTFW